jgi:hypothetical protein
LGALKNGLRAVFLRRDVMDSPSQTAISGHACLLQSLRSDVVGPHTRLENAYLTPIKEVTQRP